MDSADVGQEKLQKLARQELGQRACQLKQAGLVWACSQHLALPWCRVAQLCARHEKPSQQKQFWRSLSR